MKVLAHWDKLVVVGIMAFLTVVLVVGYVISERQQYRILHPAYSEQYSAGSAINQLVGATIENYESVIDAESQNLDCTLQHCETSSKSIPGCRQIGRCLPKRNDSSWAGGRVPSLLAPFVSTVWHSGPTRQWKPSSM